MSPGSDTIASSPGGPASVVTSTTSKKGGGAFLVTLNKHETQINKHDADIEGLETKVRRLTEDNKVMRDELDLIKRTLTIQGKAHTSSEGRLAALEAVNAEKDRGQSSGDDDSDDDVREVKDGIITKREEDAIAASLAAYADTSLKELTRLAFSYKLNIARLTPPTNLPWYPESLDPTIWPRITGTEDPVLRFRWDKPWDHDDNYYALRMIMGHMNSHGAGMVPAAAGPLSKISSDDLKKRVVEKFTSLQKSLREAGLLNSRNQRIVTVAAAVMPEVVGDEDQADVAIKAESKSKINMVGVLLSRAKGKLTVRNRKRENLPADSPYRDKKYDSAFVAKLMSDDEDEVDKDGKRTGRYISHAPAYRSAELKNLFAAVDATSDPQGSAKYIQRVIGSVREDPPKLAKKSENKTRRWMVDEAWLSVEGNKQYDVESRIIDSGKAWGDDEDPEVLAAQREKLKMAKKEISEAKKRKALEEATRKGTKKAKRSKGKGKARDDSDESE